MNLDDFNDGAGMFNSVSGAGGQGFFASKESMGKGALKASCNIANSAAAIAKTAGAASAVAGPIGAGVAYAVDTCITFYEASQDIGKAHSKVCELEKLQNTPGTPKSKEILAWMINKLKRRENYSHAETGGTHKMADGIKEQWKNGTAGGKAAAVAMGAGMGTVAAASTVGGQLASKATRAFRGFAKKTGMMGSKREGYARELYHEATVNKCKLAQKIMSIVMVSGVASPQAATEFRKRIDEVMTSSLSKAMSSFKE